MGPGDSILQMLAIFVSIAAFIYCVSVYGVPGTRKSRNSPNFRLLFYGVAIGGWGVIACLFFSKPSHDLVSVLTLTNPNIMADVIGVGYGVVMYALLALLVGWIAESNGSGLPRR